MREGKRGCGEGGGKEGGGTKEGREEAEEHEK